MSRDELEGLAALQDVDSFWESYWKNRTPVLSEAARMFCESPKLGNAARRVLRWIDEGRLNERTPAWGPPRGRKRPRHGINYAAVANEFESQTGLSPSDYSLVTTVDPYEDRFNIVFYAVADDNAPAPDVSDSHDVRAAVWCTRDRAEVVLAGDSNIQRERRNIVMRGFDDMDVYLFGDA